MRIHDSDKNKALELISQYLLFWGCVNINIIRCKHKHNPFVEIRDTDYEDVTYSYKIFGVLSGAYKVDFRGGLV